MKVNLAQVATAIRLAIISTHATRLSVTTVKKLVTPHPNARLKSCVTSVNNLTTERKTALFLGLVKLKQPQQPMMKLPPKTLSLNPLLLNRS